MSATIPHPSLVPSGIARTLRFGAESGVGGGSVQWVLKRNCSASPGQLLGFYASLCVISAAVSVFCWIQGATLVMPFAWAEIVAFGIALLVYASHATDHERIRLERDRVTVEHTIGRHTERAEFASAWLRVEPEHGERSLIELSGQGQRISVGRFVRPELRRQLADELRWALRRWQGAGGGAWQDPTEN